MGTIEWELMPAAIDAGIDAIVWGLLAAGWLTGKYTPDRRPTAGTRLCDTPNRDLEDWDRRGGTRTWAILDGLRTVAANLNVTMSQAALAWVAHQPGVAAPIVGARTVDQLADSLDAAELRLAEETTAFP